MRLLLASALLVLSACGRTAAPEPQATTQPKPPSDALIDAMHSNLSLTATAHTALMRGDLSASKKAMSALASKPRIEGLPAPWMDYQVALRVRASEVSEAADATAAAAGLAKVGKACGDCHAFVGVGPKFYDVPPPPAEGSDVAAHMRHHAWGANLMWKGLVSANTDLYNRGAQALGEADMAHGSTPDALGERGVEVHTAAAEGLAAGDQDARAAAYASVLGSCAGCHAALEVNPTIPYTPTLTPK